MSEKQSLLSGLQENLLKKERKEEPTIFYVEGQSQLYSTAFDIDSLKAGQVISEVLRKTNKEHNTCLSERNYEYEIYGAKKNGKKKDDLPAIEHPQILKKTNLKRFYICLINSQMGREKQNQLVSEMKIGERKKSEVMDQRSGKRGFFSWLCLKYL